MRLSDHLTSVTPPHVTYPTAPLTPHTNRPTHPAALSQPVLQEPARQRDARHRQREEEEQNDEDTQPTHGSNVLTNHMVNRTTITGCSRLAGGLPLHLSVHFSIHPSIITCNHLSVHHIFIQLSIHPISWLTKQYRKQCDRFVTCQFSAFYTQTCTRRVKRVYR